MFQPVMAMDGKVGRHVRRLTLSLAMAALPEIPTALMTQLDEGGILVLPVGEEHQYLKRVRRRGGEFIIDTVEAVRFVPLVKGELA